MKIEIHIDEQRHGDVSVRLRAMASVQSGRVAFTTQREMDYANAIAGVVSKALPEINQRLGGMSAERISAKPTIVCLCGSTRFMEAFQEANLKETLAGKIVLSIGCNTKSDTDLMAAGELTEEVKARLDELHKRKIDLADEVLILNVGGYIGESTKSEMEYARRHFKTIRLLEPILPEAA